MSDENEIKVFHSLYKETIPVLRFKLKIGDFKHEDTTLDNFYNELESAAETDIIDIDISSNGGAMDEMNKLINTIQDHFYGRITTRLNPFGLSCGAYLFLIGDTRIVYENSYAMFHDVTLGVYGKHSDIKTRTKFNEGFLNGFIVNTLEPYFTNSEIDDILNGKEFWLDATEMCRRNIATHISLFNQLLTADEFNEINKSPKNKLAFYNDLLKDPSLSNTDKFKIETKIKKLKTIAKK